MIEEIKDCGIWRTIHNAIPVERYRYSPRPASPPYLAFLGRITPNKGTHIAIRVARQTGIKLVIGGNIGNAQGDKEYFEKEIQPYIDTKQVEYIGELDDSGKEKLLGDAVALLNPIQWDELFGIVTVEALACGTPVIAFARGELPYVINHGVTGFLCTDEAEMVRYVMKVSNLSREACRRDAKARFDVIHMVNKFDEVYRWLIAGETSVPPHWAEV